MSKIIFFWLTFIFVTHNINASEYYKIQNTGGVKFLAGGKYYDSLIDDLKKAEKDIFVFMYLIRYSEIPYHPVYKLVNELISAKERGLNVTVYLDDHTKEGKNRTPANLNVYDLLKARGINIQIDRGKKIYHSKVVIIDNKIVYCGSHNWTAAAFNMNTESSVRLISTALAESLKKSLTKSLPFFE